MSTTVINSPRYLSQHHRAPHSPHSSPPSSTRSPPRSLSSLSSFNSAGPPPPAPPALKAPPAPSSEKLPLAPPPPTVLPQECYQQGYPLSPEEERRRRKQVEDAEGWSVLASQHHKSEYNRLKWGDKGSRLYYVPLSIQLPSHVHELMSKQAIFETYCANQQQAQATPLSNQPPFELGGPAQDGAKEEHAQGGRMTPPRDLEQEEGLEGTLVSDELEVEGGADQETTTANDGTSTTTMDLGVKDQILQAMQDQLVVPSSSIFPTPPSSQPSPTPTHQNLTSNGQQPASAPPPSVARPAPAVFSSIEAGRGEYSRQAQQQNEMGGRMMEQQQHHVVVAQPVKTSDSHPINISILIPPSYIPLLSPLLSIVLPDSPPPPGFESSRAYLPSSPQPNTTTSLNTIPSSPISPKTTSSSATFEQTSTGMQPFRLPPLLDLYLLSLSAPSVDSAPDLSLLTTDGGNGENERKGGKVGNFLLSSCPGKKVRLTGPVKGRGAICRDLKVDLERIRGLGVGCVVCCLDDEELNYLGAPFEEYAKNAKLVGLDVIRIPMPEGLTPTSLPAFDSQITHIIRTYTLRGIDVLSHCRGGVGRASIVAGSWAIKMGLIIPPAPPSRFANPTYFNGGRGGGMGEREKEEWARRVWEMEDYATVERVIAVLRRRRSLKAIETYEQVRWLMEYVCWLREEGRVLELPRNEAAA